MGIRLDIKERLPGYIVSNGYGLIRPQTGTLCFVIVSVFLSPTYKERLIGADISATLHYLVP